VSEGTGESEIQELVPERGEDDEGGRLIIILP